MREYTYAYATADDLTAEEVLDLYGSVGWSAYTDAPDALMGALAGSASIAVARERGTLVGLARVISDGFTICYLQDILVHPGHQRAGIGQALVALVLEPYSAVRQKVLLTDDEPAQKAFYESLGYTDAAAVPGGALHAFVRFDRANA